MRIRAESLVPIILVFFVGAAVPAQTITEFSLPSGSHPVNIAPGPGGMWFTQEEPRIGRITPDGQVSEFPIDRPAWGIVAGPDGNLWFTSNGLLSRMTPDGVVTNFPLTGNAWGITVGPDRNIWFTELGHFPDGSGYLGRATADGQITELPIRSWAESITTGPDGNFWIPDWTEICYDAIVRVTPSGIEKRFGLPGGLNCPGDVGPAELVVAADGNVWFTLARVPQIGRITMAGEITVFGVGGDPRDIAAGADGNLWFTEPSVDKIGRMTPRGEYVEFTVPRAPWGISAGSDGNVWFTERAAGRIGRITIARAPALDSRILPIVGSTPGANGTFFRTSIQLHNPGDSTIDGRIVFHPSGLSGTNSDPTLFYSLLPGQTRSFADLLPAMSLSGVGSADIEVTSGSAPVTTVRVFNDAGTSGTTGFTEEPMSSEEALRPGRSGVLLLPTNFEAYRFNLGVRTREAAVIALTVRDASGTIVATISRTFPASYHEQRDASAFLDGAALPPGGSIGVAVDSGSAIVYGATVDNTTGDPSLQLARLAP